MNSDQFSIITILRDQVLASIKDQFVGKDEIVDLLGISLVARENLFLHGPPGTAKSALVHAIAKRIEGRSFDYLLTRFTEPNELFGPFDIAKLKEGELVTNTEGMLPQAEIIFLDELFNANSAILNSLLMALNERIFRRGRETYNLPALFFVGASNGLPEDEALSALFDRFLLRASCGPVEEDQLRSVLVKGWQKEAETPSQTLISASQIRELQDLIPSVDLSGSTDAYLELIKKLREAGIELSDRRSVRLQRVIASSALLSGRLQSRPSDLWILRHVWSREEQIDILASIVTDTLSRFPEEGDDHPSAKHTPTPDPEILAQQIDTLASELSSECSDQQKAVASDEARRIASSLEWLHESPEKLALNEKLSAIWLILQA